MDDAYADKSGAPGEDLFPAIQDSPEGVSAPPPRRWWVPWVLAGTTGVVVAVGAVGIAAGRRVGREPELPHGLKYGIEHGLLAKDSAISPTDKTRELLVTSSMLRKPFTVTIPDGLDARGGGITKIRPHREFALYAWVPPTQGLAVSYTIIVLDLKPIDLTQMTKSLLDGERDSGLQPDLKEVGGPITTAVGARPAVQQDVTFMSPTEGLVRYRLVATVVGDQPVLFYLTAPDTQFAAHEAAFAEFLASARGN